MTVPLGIHSAVQVQIGKGSGSLDDLEAQAGQPVAFYVSATSPGRVGAQDTERYPSNRPIQVEVPGEAFSGDHWRA